MDPHKIREVTIRAVLVAFIFASIAIELISPESSLGRLQTPVILLGLVLIVELLVPIGARVQRVVEAVEAPHVRTYKDALEFYQAMGNALKDARTTADLTHIRAEDPADYGVTADGWFEDIRDWVRADKKRSARRVISSSSPKTLAWAEELRAQVVGTNFYLALTPWPLVVPSVNVAILDKSRVFMALPGAIPIRSVGFETDDPATVAQFCEAFEALWNSSDKLDALRQHASGRLRAYPDSDPAGVGDEDQ